MKRLLLLLILGCNLQLAWGQGNTVTLPVNGPPSGLCNFLQLANDVTNGNIYFASVASGVCTWTKIASASAAGASDFGTITWNASGTCTFPAASAGFGGAVLTTVSGQTCTLSPTGLVKWGSYTLKIINAASTAATLTLGTAGSCSAWKVGGGGSGAITLSGSSDIDVLAFTFDGTNCLANFRGNFN